MAVLNLKVNLANVYPAQVHSNTAPNAVRPPMITELSRARQIWAAAFSCAKFDSR